METSWICEDFLDTLKTIIEIEEFEFPDYGKIPDPDSSYGHHYDSKTRFFTYKSEQDFDRAGDVSGDFTRRVISGHSGIGIYLLKWRIYEPGGRFRVEIDRAGPRAVRQIFGAK